MEPNHVIAIIGLFIALVSLVTNFILQRDKRTLRELERKNKALKSSLQKAIMGIKGYQANEEWIAEALKMSVTTYRRKVRENKREYFDSAFLAPKNVEQVLKDLQDG